MLTKEEKSQYSKIKKFFSGRDFDKIKMGIDLVKSLNNKNIYNEFLNEVSLEKGWNDIVGLNSNSTFKHDWGTNGPDQHYYTTAILGLINYAPEGSKGELLRNSIEKLSLNGVIKSNYSEEKSKIYVEYLSNFKNLKTLILDSYQELIGFENLFKVDIKNLELKRGLTIPKGKDSWKLNSLEKLYIDFAYDIKPEDIPTDFNFLSDTNNLECLNFNGVKSKKFSLNGLQGLKKLRFLKIANSGIKNLNELKSLLNLKCVEFIGENQLKSTEGIENSSELYSIIFSNCGITDSKSLKDLNNLKEVSFYNCKNLESLEGLENSLNLLKINIENTSIKNLNPLINTKKILSIHASNCCKLENIEGLKNSENLVEIDISNSCTLNYSTGEIESEGALKSLKGLENSKKLKVIRMSKSSIVNLDPIINSSIVNNSSSVFDKNEISEDILSFLENDNDDSVDQFDNIFQSISISLPKNPKVKLRSSGSFDKLREYYKDRGWDEPTLNEFILSDCHNLESIEGLKNSDIQLLKLSNCPKIINVDYMSQFSNLQCVDFDNCSSLTSVVGLSDLPIDRLFLGKCYKVKPKPRFLKMDSVEKVTEYFSKFKKTQEKIKVSNSNKDIIDKLKKLIISDNYEEINLGLDLATTISDIEIFDFFLNGIKYNGNEILPNPIFLTGTKKLKEFREYALKGMVSISPDGCDIASKIKSQITQISINGDKYTSLYPVSGFTNLESLTIEDTLITLISDLSRLKNLKKIILKSNKTLSNLEGIKSLKKIEEINILPKESWQTSCDIVDLKGISDLENLKVLNIYNCEKLISLNGLENLNSLEILNIRKCQKLVDIGNLSKLKSLKSISLRECESISSLKCLEQLPNLNLLDIRFHNITDSDELSKLSKPIIESLRQGTLTF